MENSARFHENFEQRFGCCICFGPKLEMVSGQCQHRICADCLYLEGVRRPCMFSCPMCGLSNSFPVKRPILPQEVIEVQKILGVQKCAEGCGSEMWFWEIEDHLLSCSKVAKQSHTPVKSKLRNRRRSRVSDIGPVSVISRNTRSHRKSYSLRRRDSVTS